MLFAEAQRAQTAQSWSTKEELIIKAIQQAESVPRFEAIRRMQRRKQALRRLAKVGANGQKTCRRAWQKYQRAVCSVAASHRKLGANFSKI